ncbi:MAG: hypothetical protein D6803_00040 [Anaerolineae bacterium]|nr:MAG: hypothetical protein D6803_00040 [Anaerolineae bacterium]
MPSPTPAHFADEPTRVFTDWRNAGKTVADVTIRNQQGEGSMSPSAHITAQSTLAPAINAWRFYLEDQGHSPHTVKAFLGDLRLLASYLPPDRAIGAITTADLNNFLHWM